jgi:predicted DNA-binding WGR domain protein
VLVQYFEYVGDSDDTKSGSSAKFWEISIDGQNLWLRYGKIGATGQKTLKTFDSESEATKAAEKLIAEKLRKGYASKNPGGQIQSLPSDEDNPIEDFRKIWMSLSITDELAEEISPEILRGVAYAELSHLGLASLNNKGLAVVKRAHKDLAKLAGIQ